MLPITTKVITALRMDPKKPNLNTLTTTTNTPTTTIIIIITIVAVAVLLTRFRIFNLLAQTATHLRQIIPKSSMETAFLKVLRLVTIQIRQIGDRTKMTNKTSMLATVIIKTVI